ncbi:MAG TPA: carboxypeptidase regulatory-like domain-containing protein [Bryobacteraceae bacterium]|nr:carboxypeptidase regulatory-like domain-containing protein [Bryobacteraceae bacterium]
MRLLCSRLALVAFLTLLFTICVPFLMAQSAGTSALTGTVTDPSGAAIPNVTVTITSNATGQVRTTTTGVDGVYKFSLMLPGSYKVSFSANGFKTSEVATEQLNVTETEQLDRTLQVGAQAEQITVEAAAEALQTQSSTLGTTVTSQQVTGLPLSNRNYTQLLTMAAGANTGVNNATQIGKATQDIAVNGADPSQNNYQMDGVSIVNTANTGSSKDCGIYTGIGIPNPDAIQEFKIQTSTYDASYGAHPGANVNVVTRSGSNQFHGSVWEFFRNTDLNANSFFDNLNGGGVQQALNQNQVGGSVGGPIKKDKIFFFVDYQETRQKNGIAAGGSSSVFLFPLPADRTAANLGAALCPANHPGNPAYNTFLYPIIPSVQVACDGSNINPVSLAMMNIKLPNGQFYIPSNPTGNYGPVEFSSPAYFTEHQLIANGDYVINSKNTLAVRYFWTADPESLAFANATSPPGTPVALKYNNTNAVLRLTTLISNTLVNELHASGQRNGQHGSDSTPATPQSIGQATIVPTITELPVTVILNGPSLNGSLYPSNSPTDQVEYGDQISWSHGRHTIRAGYEFQYAQWPITFEGLERGFLFYGTFADWTLGLPGCQTATCSPSNPGNTNGGSGNILQCLFCVRSGPNGIVHNYVENNQTAFVQDDWKVSSQLTFNLGVRWEYDGSYSDKYGNLTNFWESLIQAVPVPPTGPTTSGPGLAGYVVPSNYTNHYPTPPAGVYQSNRNFPVQSGPPLTNFAPRFGFAWQPKKDGKLVVRGGLGMFYDRIGGGTFVHGLEQGYPYAVTLDYSGGASAPFDNQNPYPSTPLGVFASRWVNFGGCQPSCLFGAPNSNLNTPSLDQVLHTPLTRQYNINFQYEFAPSWVLEAGYVGSSSLNLLDQYHDVNAPLLASPTNPINGITVNTELNAALRVPILGYGTSGYQVTAFDASSNYNSLQVTLRKQFTHGFLMQASYTFSKDLSDIPEVLTGTGANSNLPTALAQQYGPVGFSHPQRVVINYAYDLPFGQHTGALGLLANGWNVSGVTTMQDGTPLTLTNQNNGTVYDIGTYDTARAQVCPGYTYGQIGTPGTATQRIYNYFNTAAINCVAPAAPNSVAAGPYGVPTMFGDSGPGIILGPGNFNWDISIVKTFRITERQQVIFRSEFFNTFNHPQFANPAVAVDTPATFGQITATSVNPRIIQFALKYIF